LQKKFHCFKECIVIMEDPKTLSNGTSKQTTTTYRVYITTCIFIDQLKETLEIGGRSQLSLNGVENHSHQWQTHQKLCGTRACCSGEKNCKKKQVVWGGTAKKPIQKGGVVYWFYDGARIGSSSKFGYGKACNSGRLVGRGFSANNQGGGGPQCWALKLGGKNNFIGFFVDISVGGLWIKTTFQKKG